MPVTLPDVLRYSPCGRLTLTSGSPVMTANVTGATSIYYTPYIGAIIPIYDGSIMVPVVFSELTNTTTNNTTNPAACTTNSNYDLFVWLNGTTVTLSRGPAWTSDTARGTGAGTTELERVQGVLTNKVAITNGPGANRGTYVGTIRTDGSSQANWHVGGIAASGTAALLNVWNYYNRISVSGLIGDTTDTWTYTTATWRPANNSNTMRASFVQGVQEEGFSADYVTVASNTGASNYFYVSIGLDSTSAPSGYYVLASAPAAGYGVIVQGGLTTQAIGFQIGRAHV